MHIHVCFTAAENPYFRKTTSKFGVIALVANREKGQFIPIIISGFARWLTRESQEEEALCFPPVHYGWPAVWSAAVWRPGGITYDMMFLWAHVWLWLREQSTVNKVTHPSKQKQERSSFAIYKQYFYFYQKKEIKMCKSIQLFYNMASESISSQNKVHVGHKM